MNTAAYSAGPGCSRLQAPTPDLSPEESEKGEIIIRVSTKSC